MKTDKELLIFVDGASKGNPGESGVGILIKNKENEVLKKISKSIGQATNNIAEYYALIFALQEALRLKAGVLTVHTDSQLLYSQVKGIYRVRDEKLKPLYQQIIRLLEGFSRVYLKNIRREENREADELANKACHPSPPNLF